MYLSILWSSPANAALFAYVVVMFVRVVIRIARPIAENTSLFLVVTAAMTHFAFSAATTAT